MKHWNTLAIAASILTAGVELAAAQESYSWRYYRPGNTGIQGDYNEAIWIGPDGDPYIGGYVPTFEEGGFAKFVQADNRWINYSNVDYPVIGHPDDTGCARVSDIVADASGKLWLATGRGALRFDPLVGGSSILNYGASNSLLPGGWTSDIDIAPNGDIWFASISVAWGGGGITRYQPSSGTWAHWDIGDRQLSVQPKPGGGYYVWSADTYYGYVFRFDSDTQAWTTLTFPPAPGDIVGMPGKDCVDEAGNFWALRLVPDGGWETLDYRRPDGTWVTPAPPYPSVTFDTSAFRAFGNAQALLANGNGDIFRFDGAAWQSLGQWRPGGNTQDVNIDDAGNVWASGIGGAAKRDVRTGAWQRYRITNTSQIDYFVRDLSLGQNGDVWVTANAGTGVGGMERFDGTRWYGWNDFTYGLGGAWPFQTDDSDAIAYRPSNGHVVVNPTFNGIREWTGSTFATLDTSSSSKGLVEDSLGRVWSIDEYFSLRYHNGSNWTQMGITGWGSKVQRDPTRPGTIWAATDYEIQRTDGSNTFSRSIADFPGSATWFTGFAADANGIAWVGTWTQFTSTGSTLIRLDTNTGAYQVFDHDQGWPFPGEHVRPLTITPDGRLWLQYDSEYPSPDAGLCWYDGVNVGTFPAPPGSVPQWGGLPNSSIGDLEVRVIPGGYELWMSCVSRGIAVLTVLDEPVGTLYCAGDGSVSPCPCGNSSPAGTQAGCLNSTGSGAELRGVGTASVAADNLSIRVAKVKHNVFGLAFMGGSTITPTPFGDGLRCVGGPLFRFAVANTGSSGSYSYGPGQIAWVHSHLPPAAWIAPGSTWRFQGYFRDPSGPCAAGFNISNALEVQFTP